MLHCVCLGKQNSSGLSCIFPTVFEWRTVGSLTEVHERYILCVLRAFTEIYSTSYKFVTMHRKNFTSDWLQLCDFVLSMRCHKLCGDFVLV